MDLDPAPDPAIFVRDLEDLNKKEFFFLSFFAFSCLKVHSHPKIKSHEEVTELYESRFFLLFFS
jgi:hypothetical protein